MISSRSRTLLAEIPSWRCLRSLSTLPHNPHIYTFPTSNSQHLLTLLPDAPPIASLALGTTIAIPPTPASFTTNPHFLNILNSVLAQHASSDPSLKAQAKAFATSASTPFASNPPHRRRLAKGGGDGAGGASSQGGAGGGGRGGWVHLSDERHTPDYGRIAWPEDIFGSLEVDARGEFVEGEGDQGKGRWVESGTYRIVTNEGILGLSDYLREKVAERLRSEAARLRGRYGWG